MQIKAELKQNIDLQGLQAQLWELQNGSLAQHVGDRCKRVIERVLRRQSYGQQHPLSKYAHTFGRGVSLQGGPDKRAYPGLSSHVQYKVFGRYLVFGFGYSANTFSPFLENIAREKQSGVTITVTPEMRRLFGAAAKYNIPGFRPLRATTNTLKVPRRPHNAKIRSFIRSKLSSYAEEKLKEIKL